MIALLWPFEVPSRPSALLYHFVYLATTASELNSAGIDCVVFDGGANISTKGDLLGLPWDEIDLCAIVSEPSCFLETIELLNLVKSIPGSRLSTCIGTTATLLGDSLFQYGFDSVWRPNERSISEYLVGLVEGNHCIEVPIRAPMLDKVPYEQYFSLRRKREVTIEIARGCRFSCYFCNAWRNYGNSENYIDIDEIGRFIVGNSHSYSTIGLYAPNASANREWFREFLGLASRTKTTWKATIAPSLLGVWDLELLSKSGCYEICIGVETFDVAKNRIDKPILESQILDIVHRLRLSNIIAKCYLVSGLPGASVEGLLYTAERLRAAGGQTRINQYVDYEKFISNPVEYSLGGKSNRGLFWSSVKPISTQLISWQNKIPSLENENDVHEYDNYKLNLEAEKDV